jgi:subtilisin
VTTEEAPRSRLRPAWSEAFLPEALRQVPSARVGIDRSWAFDGADGSGVHVAVIDSGIDRNHPLIGGPLGDGVAMSWDRDAEQVVTEHGDHEDLFGHGTACAAIIRKTAPGCTLHSVRVLGSRLTGKAQVFAEGLRWAINRGCRVANLSLSTGRQEYFGTFHEVADEAYFAGVLLVCAVNNVPAPTYPSQFSSVISVAATDDQDPFAIVCNPSPPVEFGAPGIDVEVAWLAGSTIVATGNSFAAPHVTGLVARLLSKHPDLTPYEVKTVLRAVARNTGSPA